MLIINFDRLGHIWRLKQIPLFRVQIFCSSQFCLNILKCIVLLQKFTIVNFYMVDIFYLLCKKVGVDWFPVHLVYKLSKYWLSCTTYHGFNGEQEVWGSYFLFVFYIHISKFLLCTSVIFIKKHFTGNISIQVVI